MFQQSKCTLKAPREEQAIITLYKHIKDVYIFFSSRGEVPRGPMHLLVLC